MQAKLLFDRLMRLVPVLFAAILLSSCATHYGAVAFVSEPEGVSVTDLEDGSVIGVTPVKYVWRSKDAKRKYMNVQLHKDGYRDAVKSFWLALDYGNADDAAANPQSVQFELNQKAE
jgi:hypothetical protein